jgi:hypothetical protein
MYGYRDRIVCYRCMVHGRRTKANKYMQMWGEDQFQPISSRIRLSVSVATTSVTMGNAACLRVSTALLPSGASRVRSHVAITLLPFNNYTDD